MTQFIQDSDIPPRAIFTPLSRYLESRIFLYSERRVLTLETYKRTGYVVVGNERSMLITKGLEYRPDLVSYDIYGIVDAWWKIMEANKISDVFDFKAGRTIILPNSIL